MNAPFLSNFSQTVIKKIKSEQKVKISVVNPEYPDFLFVTKDEVPPDDGGSTPNNGDGSSNNGGGTIIGGEVEPDDVITTENNFNAKGKCFIIADIEGIDFTEFKLDGQTYNVSYGLNAFPVEFPEELTSYQISINDSELQYFKFIVVEPLFIAEDQIEVDLDQDTEINFQAGGPISILMKINFPYNWLSVNLTGEDGTRTTLKKIYATDENYPEVDPLFFSLIVEHGEYIRYDMDCDPGNYTLNLRGNGTIEYKIVVNSDWDRDLIGDVDELQQDCFYDFNLNPTIPDVWGFYEKSDEKLVYTKIEGSDFTEGFFSFYIPEIYPNNKFLIKVNSGEFKEVVVDGDSLFFEHDVFIANRYSQPDRRLYKDIAAGWHHIAYKHKANYTSDIEFLVNYEPVKVLKIPENLDTDGDGIKDLDEYSTSLNPEKVDTDEDGVPDNLDSSPLAKKTLKRNKIYQMVLPTNYSKNTIINIQIKKPNKDYSTNGVPRLWKDTLNVSIYPVLRMFGNKWLNIYTEYNMNRDKLSSLWGKQVLCLFESDESYNEKGIGDPLPNPSDPNSEYYFISPNPAEESLGYNINIPKAHASKTDGLLDLRFDFIWLVTCYDPETQSSSILHYYDFEENILVQSMGMREISDVEYKFGSPDNFIENQILWTLTQNPALGTPEDFGVSDDIIGEGNVDYFDLPAQTALDRKNNPLQENKAEVLYYTGLFKNYDVLNKVNLQNIGNPDFDTLYQGDFEACFSFSIISNLYEEFYFFGDSEILSETKILYQIYYDNFSINQNNDIQQRVNILEIPVAMELYANSKVLKISQAQGFGLSLDQISRTMNLNLNERITILNNNYIECDQNEEESRIPLLNFQEGDVYKETIDTWESYDEWADRFFESDSNHPISGAQLMMMQLNEFWNRIGLINESLDLLKNEFSTNNKQLPQVVLSIEDIINEVYQYSYSELNDYTDFFRTTSNLLNEILKIDLDLDFNWAPHVFNVARNFCEAGVDITDFIHSHFGILGRGSPIFGTAHFNWNKIKTRPRSNAIFKRTEAPVSKNYAGRAIGVVSCILGVAMVVFACFELFKYLPEDQDDISKTDYWLRMSAAICGLVLGLVLIAEGICLTLSSFNIAVKSLDKAIKCLAIVAIALAIVLMVIDSVAFKEALENTDDAASRRVLITQFAVLTVLGVIAVGAAITGIVAGAMTGAVAAGVATAATIIGIGVAIIVAVLFVIDLIITLSNDPNVEMCQSETGLELSEVTKTNMRRHGSLEVGDYVSFRLKMENTGNRPLWIRARFNVFGENWGGFPNFDGRNHDRSGDNVWYDISDAKYPPGTLQYGGGPGITLGYYGWKGHWGTGGYQYWTYDPYGHGGYGVHTGSIAATYGSDKMRVYGGYYDDGETYDEYFNSKIRGATPNIQYRLEYELDWEKKSLWGFSREDGSDDVITGYLDMPACENTISKFYGSTTKYWSRDAMIQAFESAVSEYQYKDAYNTANKVVSTIEKECKITLAKFNDINGRIVDIAIFNAYFLKVKDGWEWLGLLINYFEFGLRASEPNPDPPYGDKDNELVQNYWGYEASNGFVYFPKTWWNDIKSQMAIATEFLGLRNSLPLKTNIKSDFMDDIIEMDAMLGTVDVNRKLLLNGPTGDKQKGVTFNITPPEGFYITPQNQFTGPLSSTLDFTIVRNTTNLNVGVHFFDLEIFLGSNLIYEETVPFRIRPFSLVELDAHIAEEPIVPGDEFLAVELNNYGSYVEVVNFTVDGTIPANFIYKEYYSDDFVDDTTQLFEFYPGEVRSALVIKPPRHYTSTPGVYTYFGSARDDAYGYYDIPFEGTFEVAEFYDMDFNCLNPEISIFDYQTAVYTFNATNLGNVPQEFLLSSDDVPFANEYFSALSVNLAPGESQLFNISLIPTGWGEQTFSINASSIYNSQVVEANITIIDDDIHPPEFSNFEIIDTPIDITVNFDVLNENEGDDCGLSNIKIFFDNEFLLDHYPDPSETNFSFTFDDTHGLWFMEHGTHEVRVEIVDNDFDVPNDELSSTISGEFNTTLEDVHGYIDWQLEVLKDYVDSNLYWCLSWLWTKKINCAQKHLDKAFSYVEKGRIICALFHDHVAKVLVQIVEFRTEIFEKFGLIEENVSEYIVNSTHIIRNNIVLLMGFTTGTEIGYQIALVEIDLLNLNDLIEEEVNRIFKFRWCLKNHIRSATYRLEYALVKVSLGLDVNCTLTQVLDKLERVEREVEHKFNRGEISQELAELIRIKIEQAQEDIKDIQQSI